MRNSYSELETLSLNLFIEIIYQFHGMYFQISENFGNKTDEEAKITEKLQKSEKCFK